MSRNFPWGLGSPSHGIKGMGHTLPDKFLSPSLPYWIQAITYPRPAYYHVHNPLPIVLKGTWSTKFIKILSIPTLVSFGRYTCDMYFYVWITYLSCCILIFPQLLNIAYWYLTIDIEDLVSVYSLPSLVIFIFLISTNWPPRWVIL